MSDVDLTDNELVKYLLAKGHSPEDTLEVLEHFVGEGDIPTTPNQLERLSGFYTFLEEQEEAT